MVSKYAWGKCTGCLGRNTLVVTFDKDDELVDNFIRLARDEHFDITVTQIASRKGLTVMVKNVPYEKTIEMLKKFPAPPLQ